MNLIQRHIKHKLIFRFMDSSNTRTLTRSSKSGGKYKLNILDLNTSVDESLKRKSDDLNTSSDKKKRTSKLFLI